MFIFKLAVAIGIVVMFLVGAILAIKFFVTSAEEKAKVKEALVPYFVGCAVVIGAFSIWDIVVNIGQDITTNKGILLSASSRTFTFYVKNSRGDGIISGQSIYCGDGQRFKEFIDKVDTYEQWIGNGYIVEIEYETPVSGNTRFRKLLEEFISSGDYYRFCEEICPERAFVFNVYSDFKNEILFVCKNAQELKDKIEGYSYQLSRGIINRVTIQYTDPYNGERKTTELAAFKSSSDYVRILDKL